jgi:hypothetical protein
VFGELAWKRHQVVVRDRTRDDNAHERHLKVRSWKSEVPSE